MKILALQLKRIGDLVLTTPALAALKAWQPDCHVTLAVHSSTAGLLPVVPHFDAAIVFGAGRGWAPWQQVLTGPFDAVLDFTGSDRAALATWLSRAPQRVGFDWLRRKGLRRLAFSRFVDSSVRERHTVDHYLDLTRALTSSLETSRLVHPQLASADAPALPVDSCNYVVIHPFTARPEKNWSPEAWGEVLAACTRRGLACFLTGGDSSTESEHHRRIIEEYRKSTAGDADIPGARVQSLAGQTDLLQLCGLIENAALVISCDTAAVHLAAAYRRPQIVLFGPTNPFHWRPRHERAIILSAAQPEAPMQTFEPRLTGAPMDRISTGRVRRDIDELLAS